MDSDEEIDDITVRRNQKGEIEYNMDTHPHYIGTAARGWCPKSPPGSTSDAVLDRQQGARDWIAFFEMKTRRDAYMEETRRIEREMREKVEAANKRPYRRSNSPEF